MSLDSWGAAPDGPPRPPLRLGDYQILSELGRGGMGVVALARARDGRQVAVKLLRRDRAISKALELFERERRLLDALGEAAGFVPLLDFGTGPQGPFIVMPYIEGGTLRDRLHRGQLDVDEAVSIVAKIAAAVGHAHEKGIVHRDLKPENVLFTKDGRPLVADLGLAKHFADTSPGASQSVSLTRDGVMKGTAGYMAPEQMADSKSVGPAADVFALGAILYECVTGEPAFSGGNPVELFARVESGTFKRPSDLRARLPAWVDDAIGAALEREAADRPKDGAAFAALLERRRAPRGGGPASAAAPVAAVAAAVVAFAGGAYATRSKATVDVAVPATQTHVVLREPPTAPTTSNTPAQVFPTTYSGFLASKSGEWKLVRAWGTPRWKHAFEVRCLAYSPDGRRVASGGMEWETRLWDAGTGEDLGSTGNARGAITAIAFGPDGRNVVTGSVDGRVRIQSATPGGKDHSVVVEHQKPVVAIAYAPNGDHLYSVSADGAIRARSAGTRGLVRVAGRDQGPEVVSVAFSADRTAAILVTADGKAHLRTTEGGKDLELPGIEGANAVSCLPRDERILFAVNDRPVLYDPAREAIVRRFESAGARISSLVVSPNGAQFVSTGDRLLLWDLEKGTSRKLEGHALQVNTAVFSPDGSRLATGSKDRTIHVWDVASGALLAWDGDDSYGPLIIAASADASRFVTAHWDGRPRVWSVESPRARHAIEGHRSLVSWVAMTARGDLVASCDERGLTLVADATTGAVKARLDDGEIVLRTIAFDPGGGRVYTAGDDAQLREWDVATRRLVKKTPLPGGCRSIALSARGDRLIAACGGEAAILDLASGARVASCPSDRQVAAVALAPDGAFAAVATTKGDVIIWDTVRNVQTSSPAHRLPVQQVLFSSDATQVFSTSFDRRLRVWKGFPGESTFDEIWLQSSGDTPNSFALSADGKTLLVATLRGVVLRFEAR